MKIQQNTFIKTDEALQEQTPHGSAAFPLQYYYEDVFAFDAGCVDWHRHAEFEFVTVKTGRMRLQVGQSSTEIASGEGVFINSNILHRFTADCPTIIPNIVFAGRFIAPAQTAIYEEYVAPILDSDITHLVLRPQIDWQAHALQALDEVYAACTTSSPTELLDIHTAVCRVWATLYPHRSECSTMQASGTNRTTQARLQRMLSFVEAHYAETLTLATIADSAGISKSEALRCFKTGLQTTPIAFLNQHRLHQARTLLAETETSVTAIAEATGFESTSYFDRLFRQAYGISPRSHRRSANQKRR